MNFTYHLIKNYYNISEDLIISIININNNNTKPKTTYAFSDPITGEILNSTKVCFNEKIVIQEDVKALMKNIDDKKEELIFFCTNLCFPPRRPRPSRRRSELWRPAESPR